MLLQILYDEVKLKDFFITFDSFWTEMENNISEINNFSENSETIGNYVFNYFYNYYFQPVFLDEELSLSEDFWFEFSNAIVNFESEKALAINKVINKNDLSYNLNQSNLENTIDNFGETPQKRQQYSTTSFSINDQISKNNSWAFSLDLEKYFDVFFTRKERIF